MLPETVVEAPGGGHDLLSVVKAWTIATEKQSQSEDTSI